MTKNKVKHKVIREQKKQERVEKGRSNVATELEKGSLRDRIAVKPKKQFSKEDFEYLEIASSQPLDFAEFISQSNHGKKFQTLEQHQRFMKLITKYERCAKECIKKTNLKGEKLKEYTIKEMLQRDCFSPIDIMILQSNLLKREKQRI